MPAGPLRRCKSMDEDKLIQELAQLIEDMGWDYDRFSMSGKETYEKICLLINKLAN